jgi:hypothetical protein
LPRPPACTCAFTTQIPPPNSEQALLASLVLAIKTPLGVFDFYQKYYTFKLKIHYKSVIYINIIFLTGS